MLNALQDSGLASTGALELLEDDRFIYRQSEFDDWWRGRTRPRMEHFYREMRRRTGLLMSDGKPIGGRWNFDSENRNPPKDGLAFAGPLCFTPDEITTDVLSLVGAQFHGWFGDLEPFWFGVTREQAEGYIRQVIGWREYVRGIYWHEMPGYVDRNFLAHTRPLPDFYWSGKTEMACLHACIAQTRKEAYAHHIQRLMVTGNFAMLAGVDPKAVHVW